MALPLSEREFYQYRPKIHIFDQSEFTTFVCLFMARIGEKSTARIKVQFVLIIKA